MGLSPFFSRDDPGHLFFGFGHIVGFAESQTVANPENMRIHGKCRNSECIAQNDICGFSADPRELCQLFHGMRYFPSVNVPDDPAGTDDIGGFGAETAAFDHRIKITYIRRGHGNRIGIPAENSRGYFVDLPVGTLGGKDGCDQHFIGI